MTDLRNFLPIFFLPFGVSLIFVIAGLIRRRHAWIWTGVVILWLSSSPFVSGTLVRATEGWAERAPAIEAPAADAIVVLSTGRVIAPGPAAISEWTNANRFFGGVELFQAGKAPLLVFTGGVTPEQANAPSEGEILMGYARALGIPAERVITTERVSNTADEARAVAALLRNLQTAPPRVLLVTSAFHMPRARQLFENAGVLVRPFPVGFRLSVGGSTSVMDFLPNPGALAKTETMLREVYGRLFYHVMGFLSRSRRASLLMSPPMGGTQSWCRSQIQPRVVEAVPQPPHGPAREADSASVKVMQLSQARSGELNRDPADLDDLIEGYR